MRSWPRRSVIHRQTQALTLCITGTLQGIIHGADLASKENPRVYINICSVAEAVGH